MIFRARPENMKLILLQYLHPRMVFNEGQALTFFTIEKGYEGELKSDDWLKGLADEWLILNDLLFDYHGSRFQIDTLLIAYEKLYILDIKYWEGDHTFKEDKWSTPTGKPEKNPLHQLERCETLFQRMLHEWGFHYSIESYLIFNHPEFHLYTTSNNPAIIFPTQLNRFLKKLNTRQVKLHKRYYELAQQLVDRNIEDSPYERIFSYTYDQLKKGITCPECRAIYEGALLCKNCGYVDEAETAILRSVREFILLFPERKITTNEIYEWCGGIRSKKVIRRVLGRDFKLVGHRTSAHYVYK
ncbi:nuclease-related domain-containing protein [Neobacillus vireti]|uniref:nuclease-related domain-containing protein n=1 Tax=Neobacillus vireti TaxID=220686 RepID=UPI002FFDF9A6